MVYLLTFVSALLSVIGNITSKYWSDSRQLWLLVLTFVIYNLGTIPWLLSLRLVKFSI
jgi:multidrug transporter EmrE-like cation transporter